MGDSRDPDIEWAARSLEAHAIVTSVARLLASAGSLVMPLKGVLLDALEPTLIGSRYLGDVDVLVRPYTTSIAAMRRANWHVVATTPLATTLVSSGSTLHLDVHREVTSTVAYGLNAAGLFQRGREDTSRFGAPVVIPDPHDEFAHLVAHFTQGRHTIVDGRRVRDFGRVARRAALQPEPVARYLDQLGMGRAARYALGVAARTGDRFSESVLHALVPDTVGDVLARTCTAGLSRHASAVAFGPVFPALLARSLPRGAAVLALHGIASVRRRLAAGRSARGE